MILSTGTFNVSATTYIRRILKRWFSRYALPLTAVPVILSVMGTMVNVAFFIVVLMYIFIIVPTAMMFVYYYYALKPRIALLSAYTTLLAIDTDRQCVNISLTPPDEGRQPRHFAIDISEIKEITPGDILDTIIYGDKLDGIILIDKGAFADQSTRFQFHNYIFDNINNK